MEAVIKSFRRQISMQVSASSAPGRLRRVTPYTIGQMILAGDLILRGNGISITDAIRSVQSTIANGDDGGVVELKARFKFMPDSYMIYRSALWSQNMSTVRSMYALACLESFLQHFDTAEVNAIIAASDSRSERRALYLAERAEQIAANSDIATGGVAEEKGTFLGTPPMERSVHLAENLNETIDDGGSEEPPIPLVGENQGATIENQPRKIAQEAISDTREGGSEGQGANPHSEDSEVNSNNRRLLGGLFDTTGGR